MPTLSGNAEQFNANGWTASTNVWNPGRYQNGEDFTQTISAQSGDFPNNTKITWNWPYDSNRPLNYANFPVRAYPELIYGADPWSKGPSSTVDLPAKISDVKNLDISYDFGITGDKNLYNVAFSLWISDDPAKGLQGVTDEVMVWVHTGYFSPAGQEVAKIQDKNGPATLWTKKDFSGGVEGNPVDWEYTVMQYNKDLLAGTIDLDALLKNLADRGIVDRNDWILGVQVGAEVTAGRGSLDVKKLAVDFVGPPPAPSAPMETAAAVVATPQQQPASGAANTLLPTQDSGVTAPPTVT